EPVTRLLFHFFGLEALLTERSVGRKARLLAWRRVMLSHATKGGFAHPAPVYWLYEKVRSNAVHGSEPVEAPERDVALFESDARAALNEYLTFAHERDLARRVDVLRALDSHSDSDALLDRLREIDTGWERFEPPYHFHE